jgi:regulator of RNase E activity RraB
MPKSKDKPSTIIDDGSAPEVFARDADELNAIFMREMYKVVAEAEKRAFETNKAVETNFAMKQEDGKTILEFHFVCEPGKPARLVSKSFPK